MSVETIYQPVLPQMAMVEDKILEVANEAPTDLVEQLSYVLKNGGKRLRPALTLLSGKFYQYNVEQLLYTAAAIEVLHTATLVHDDTVDESNLRRGRLSLHCLWGNSNAVLLGDYLFAASARMTAETGNLRVIKLFSDTLMAICCGELQESLNPFNRNRDCYLQAIGNKTASLISAATESGAILSEAPEEVIQALKGYGYDLGMAFQIVDDILDFTGEKETLGKPVASDLARGIFTLPVIMMLERPESNGIADLLGQNFDEGADRLIGMIQDSSVIDECYRVVHAFCDRARSALDHLPRNPVYDSLHHLADFVTERNR